MAEELKPCPFCGGETKIVFQYLTGIYFVVCTSCGAITSFKGKEGKTSARNAYNRRADNGNL